MKSTINRTASLGFRGDEQAPSVTEVTKPFFTSLLME
jgi:hypothetical protein